MSVFLFWNIALRSWRIKEGDMVLQTIIMPLYSPLPLIVFSANGAGDNHPSYGQGRRSFYWSCRHALHPNFLLSYRSAATYIVSRAKIYVMMTKHVYTCSVELQKSFISTCYIYIECYPLQLCSFISWFTNTKTMLIRTFSINKKCHNRGWFS